MQPLITLSLDGYRAILPAGQDHAGAHRALTALLRDALGPEVTGFFAPVSGTEHGLSFFAPEGRVARFAELDATGRDRLRAEIGRIISELRRAAALAAANDPATYGHLPALVAAAIEIPRAGLACCATWMTGSLPKRLLACPWQRLVPLSLRWSCWAPWRLLPRPGSRAGWRLSLGCAAWSKAIWKPCKPCSAKGNESGNCAIAWRRWKKNSAAAAPNARCRQHRPLRRHRQPQSHRASQNRGRNPHLNHRARHRRHLRHAQPHRQGLLSGLWNARPMSSPAIRKSKAVGAALRRRGIILGQHQGASPFPTTRGWSQTAFAFITVGARLRKHRDLFPVRAAFPLIGTRRKVARLRIMS